MPAHFTSLEEISLTGACLTIGAFDGVHLGHQGLIRPMVAEARQHGAPAVVLTFHPHPSVVLRGRPADFYLTLPEERAALFFELGVDVVITQTFDLKVANTSARDYVFQLHDKLELSQLWVGPDFALGHAREGTIPVLRRLGQEFGFSVHVIQPLDKDGERISSSRIRQLISDGEVSQAHALLGRPYRLQGEVVRGDQRGRKIGIPTANLALEPGKLLPASGVYACRAWTGSADSERPWAAAANIGVRPTFDGAGTTQHVEAHLLDFEADLYGQVLRLDLLERLRGEQRFASIEALVTQIHADIDRTRLLVR